MLHLQRQNIKVRWNVKERLAAKGNKEPQNQRINEMEQEGQEDKYIKAFNFLINFQCWHCYDLLLETFYFVLYRDEDTHN